MYRYDRRIAAKAQDPALRDLAGKAVTSLEKVKKFMRDFSSTLKEAERGEGLDEGYVRMEPLSDFWRPISRINDQLEDIRDDMVLSDDRLATPARNALYLDGKARIEHAMKNPKTRPKVTYPVKGVLEWANAYEAWLDNALKVLKRIRGR